MKTLLRLSSAMEIILLLGPAFLMSWLLLASFSGVLIGYRLLTRGYYGLLFHGMRNR